ncbi:MAG: hypothetical protein ACRYG4_17200 [Janthinobacterium lividum]
MIRFYNGLFASLVALAMSSGPALAQSVQVKDANGNIQTIRAPNANGRAAAASSGPVVLSNEDLTAIGSLFKSGQNIGNTSFGISGTLPAFAATPTFNVGTMPSLTIASQALPSGAATEATLATLGSKLDTLHADNTTAAPTNLPPSDTTDQARAVATTTAVTALRGQIPATLGAKTSALSMSMAPATDAVFPGAATESHLGEVGGHTNIVAATFTTPTGVTPYAFGQLIANSATAASVVPMTFTTACRVQGGTGMVRRARIKVADTGFAATAVALQLYRDLPTITNGDHGVWLTTDSTFLGTIPVTFDKHFSDVEKGIGSPSVGSEINFDCAAGSQTIYGLLTATSGITPVGAKLVTVVLEVLEN